MKKIIEIESLGVIENVRPGLSTHRVIITLDDGSTQEGAMQRFYDNQWLENTFED